MNTPETEHAAHSADVKIHLHVNGFTLPVAQLGPEFLVLRNPVDHPPCNAEITMSIDGRETRWPVHLVNGIQVDKYKTAISNGPDMIAPKSPSVSANDNQPST